MTIHITLPAKHDASKLEFGIFNTLGQKVKAFDIVGDGNTREIRIIWDGKSDSGEEASTGLYFAVLYGPSLKKSLKLILVK